MPITRTDTNEVYRNGVVIASEQVVIDVTAQVVELGLHTKARQALGVNATFLALAAPGNTDVLKQVRALTRQSTLLAKLLLRSDLLDDTDGT